MTTSSFLSATLCRQFSERLQLNCGSIEYTKATSAINSHFSWARSFSVHILITLSGPVPWHVFKLLAYKKPVTKKKANTLVSYAQLTVSVIPALHELINGTYFKYLLLNTPMWSLALLDELVDTNGQVMTECYTPKFRCEMYCHFYWYGRLMRLCFRLLI